MPLPELTLGLVVRYEYQWHRRSVPGAIAADKDHPACVVVTFRRQGRPEDFVVYLPISHTQLSGDDEGIELSDDVKRKAGLDSGRQWLLISEYNLDTWPTELRQIPHRPGVFHYGHLPPSMFQTVVDAFRERYKKETSQASKPNGAISTIRGLPERRQVLTGQAAPRTRPRRSL